jgi:hypothetical protein
MGQQLDVTCRSCAHRSTQIDGAVMPGFNPRCADCGATRFVSIAELLDTDPPRLELATEEAWRLRYERLPGLAGQCDCGGRFAEDAPIRCRRCAPRKSQP